MVLWFGAKRTSAIPLPPSRYKRPGSPIEMQNVLRALVPDGKRQKVGVIVLDVSGEITTIV